MGIFNEILEHKIRFAKTCALYSSFIALGISMAMIGPSLLDLRMSVEANAIEINAIFPSGSGGYLLGSVFSGFVYNRFDSQLTIATFVTLLAIFMAIIPWNRTLIGLAITNCLMGFCGGGIDTTGNVWLIHLWGRSCGPFMQGLHFAFGVGAFISPLIVEPFLSPSAKNITDNDENVDDIDELGDGETQIQWAFGIGAVFSISVVIVILTMYFIKRTDNGHPSTDDNKNRKLSSVWLKVKIIGFAALLIHAYSGLEIAFGRYLTTFVHYSSMHLSKAKGAYMTSLYWGTFTFFRCLTVFIVDKFGTSVMLWFDMLLILIGNIILLIYGNSNELGLWIGVGIMGIGSSSVFPSVFAYIDDRTPLTSRIGALFLASACLGEFTMPFIVGYFIKEQPLVLIYVTTAAGVVCTVSFAFLTLVSKQIKRDENDRIELSTVSKNYN